MKFKELMSDLTWNQIKDALVKNYEITEHNLEGYMDVFLHLSTLKPVESTMRICIDWVPPDGDYVEKGYWTVHGRDGTLQKDSEDFKHFKDGCTEEFANSEISWAIEFRPWAEWLGMEIDSETMNNINLMRSDIVAHCLWELTFCGYEEEEIQDKIEGLRKQVDEIKNMSDEELQKNSLSLEDTMKRVKDKLKEKDNDTTKPA